MPCSASGAEDGARVNRLPRLDGQLPHDKHRLHLLRVRGAAVVQKVRGSVTAGCMRTEPTTNHVGLSPLDALLSVDQSRAYIVWPIENMGAIFGPFFAAALRRTG